ncbi:MULTISPECIES: enoyl-CoA hydratase-related protein [Bradyrhizobium]|uniref:Enoyl-CoA hydratase/carnithine racemase n=1 Tax=Bradyrhizobium elkanii TaxID=29448 RepID=A0A8I1YAE3_BRAEL|nr:MULTISPECIES: enoyl-CoA hydratase-related protein [Bradyrhizobium]MBP1294914.1 enoyl-CoA hydratase/carnithine racemase [Bradyrhizobium elkanii]MCP1934184.1 enoyl-CoA hydratase/carnithine racemase [Bradyrhizobium elkanii]MCS3477807.1 enoyl-CoA hydratase/carnithine racemase [Bradyrhizobium elkanii]MCS3584580.1 enoyl-CoA hydratase/carnithine racemase [Bradyrhizobium elkanii]MCS3718157.1 enoyl-CoA hydratase/carnithine racemase [Bradyrhizobium elkanii]
MTEHVKVEIAAGVMTLTLQRPEKKNALTGAMYNVMSAALKQVEADASVRVILFQGDGDSFTAGNDLADFASQARGESAVDSPAHTFIETISKVGKPIVAAVQGNAVGVGTTMLLHCDLVYLAENARLITPFVNLALVPEAASSWLLPLRIGHARAYAMFALGEPMDAQGALASGLANAVVPQPDLRKRAHDAAIALTRRPAGSLGMTKKLMREQQKIAAQIAEEGVLFKERLTTPEAREAFAAFAERRQPDFTKLSA